MRFGTNGGSEAHLLLFVTPARDIGTVSTLVASLLALNPVLP